VFIVVSVYFVIDSVRELLDTPSHFFTLLHLNRTDVVTASVQIAGESNFKIEEWRKYREVPFTATYGMPVSKHEYKHIYLHSYADVALLQLFAISIREPADVTSVSVRACTRYENKKKNINSDLLEF
jgi:hypothetical protein